MTRRLIRADRLAMEDALGPNEGRSGEAAQAYERFLRATDVMNAAANAMMLLTALPEGQAQLAAAFRMRGLSRPAVSAEALDGLADSELDVIKEESVRGFVTLKEAALVATCGAFEHLVKAFFVDRALESPVSAAEKLDSLSLKLEATEVLGLSKHELWFQVAGKAFEACGQRVPMSTRVQNFLLKHMPLPSHAEHVRKATEKVFNDLDKKAFNEAFWIRNCIVHNGARVDARLSKITGQPVATPLAWSKGVPVPVQPLKSVAELLSPYWIINGALD